MDFDEFERMRAEMDREMARAMGERAPGEDHRVWVDHEQIARLVGDEYELKKLWTFTGLSELSATDPDLPEALRRLLRTYDSGDGRYALGPLLVIATGVLIAVLAPGARGIGIGVAVAGGASGYLMMLTGDDFLEKHGKRVPGSRQRRLLADLEALRAHPFAVVAGGRLVENLPVLSWLDAEDADLDAASDAAGDRKRDMEEVAERLRKARKRLGDDEPDVLLERLDERIEAEEALMGRVAKVRAEIAQKRKTLRAQVDALRDRVEVEALREQAAALTGSSVPSTPERVAANLEVDFPDLRVQLDEIHAEIADGELRYRAMNEVSALG